MGLSFLALPVIPDLKITDRGLVDVNRLNGCRRMPHEMISCERYMFVK
jgi:adenine deaminase